METIIAYFCAKMIVTTVMFGISIFLISPLKLIESIKKIVNTR